ncbi:MAG: hypothetical protein ACI9FB_003112 [Candidatus Azotimanducaceae bacterium]|jgi:hypothetical protein
MARGTLTKEKALSFILTHIVVTKARPLSLTPHVLFELMTLASDVENTLEKDNDLIPHEVIESLTDTYIDSQT